MPVLKIYGLPDNTGEQKLCDLRTAITAAIVAIKELEIDESKVTIFFPSDLSDSKCHPFEIVGYIDLFKSAKRTTSVRRKLAGAVGGVLAKNFPKATFIEILPRVYNPEPQGYWNLRRK